MFAKPAALDFPAAANLLLAGATAAEMLHVIEVRAGETVLVHGASGAVGVSVLQQARLTRRPRASAPRASAASRPCAGSAVCRSRTATGLADRLRAAAPDGVAAAIDTVGTDEAVDVSLELVADRDRIVTIAAIGRAGGTGIRVGRRRQPGQRGLPRRRPPAPDPLAGAGDLVVPVARTFPLTEAREAVRLLMTGHPGGKLALLPEG